MDFIQTYLWNDDGVTRRRLFYRRIGASAPVGDTEYSGRFVCAGEPSPDRPVRAALGVN